MIELNYQTIIAIAATSNIIVISDIPAKYIRRYFLIFHNKKIQSVKPFSCALCMGFWLMLAYQLQQGNYNIDAILISFTASLFSETINRLFNNIPI